MRTNRALPRFSGGGNLDAGTQTMIREDVLKGWRVTVEVRVHPGPSIVTGLTIRPVGDVPPDSGLTTTKLRQLNVTGLLGDAVDDFWRAAELADELEEARYPADTARKITATKRRLRKLAAEATAGSDLELLRWAVLYDEKTRAGSASPLADVARDLKVTQAKVRDKVYDARHLPEPLLKPAVRGRAVAGPQLTDRAYEMLRSLEETR